MSEIIFDLENVDYTYLNRFPALRKVNLNIRLGQRIAITGANGSGKSTLLHLLDGLIFPCQGRISFLGKELKEDDFNDVEFCRDFRRKVGFVFQNPDVQLFCPSVNEDIIFGPLQLGFGRKIIQKNLESVCQILNLTDLLDRQPHQLSVGEKRKVALASVLAISPQILILDEPTAGLDPLTTRQIIDLLMRASAEGKTIITSTHDLHIIEEISDTVFVFNADKRLAAFGETKNILGDSILLQENNLAHIHTHRHNDGIHLHAHEHLDHHS